MRKLGLGSKQYPSNMQHMLSKLDSCRVFLEYPKIDQAKEKLGWQGIEGQASGLKQAGLSLRFQVASYMQLVATEFFGVISPYYFVSYENSQGHAHSSRGDIPSPQPLVTALNRDEVLNHFLSLK